MPASRRVRHARRWPARLPGHRGRRRPRPATPTRPRARSPGARRHAATPSPCAARAPGRVVRGQERVHRPLPAEELGPGPGRLAAFALGPGQQLLHRVREGRPVCRARRAPASPDHLGQRGRGARDDRGAAGQRLQRRRARRSRRAPGPGRRRPTPGERPAASRSPTCPRNGAGSRSARARCSSAARSGPSPATTSAARTPAPPQLGQRVQRRARAASPRTAGSTSRSRTSAPRACRARSTVSRSAGCRQRRRSTPSGARTTLRAPIRTNSRSAHSVVHTIARVRPCAVRRLSRSAARPGDRLGQAPGAQHPVGASRGRPSRRGPGRAAPTRRSSAGSCGRRPPAGRARAPPGAARSRRRSVSTR